MSRILLSMRLIMTQVISNLTSNLLTCQIWRFKANSHKANSFLHTVYPVFNLQRVVINVLDKWGERPDLWTYNNFLQERYISHPTYEDD